LREHKVEFFILFFEILAELFGGTALFFQWFKLLVQFLARNFILGLILVFLPLPVFPMFPGIPLTV